MPDEFSSRHLLVRVAQIAALIALVAVAVSALPGLDDVKSRVADADPTWVVACAVAELGSCAGYLLVFRDTFCTQMPWGLSYDIAMSELAANSLLPAGGAGGLALGVWALRESGMPTAHIARRTVAFFVVTSAANFVALILVGLGVFLGIISGNGSAVLTLVPALVTAAGAVFIGFSPRLLRALGQRGTDTEPDGLIGRAKVGLRRGLSAGADGIEQAILLLRSPQLRRDRRLARVHGLRHRRARLRLRRGRAGAPHRHADPRLPDRAARQPDPAARGASAEPRAR